ncbi:DEDD exonuclease domain-containing protein [soil metagenome]
MSATLGGPTDKIPPVTFVSASTHTVGRVTSIPHTQLEFDDLGRALSSLTFCVVDLETTGGSAARGAKITEIGAVKVCGGEVIGEFQTLVNPEESIPAFITVLTGITDQMVIAAPVIAEALPSFLEFARGSVLVAHNAPFDVGFLKHNARALDHEWPAFEVLDTVVLARRVMLRDEVPNCKLATLAMKFGATTKPNHRALEDARATVDVLHGLFERLGPLGVTTLEEVASYTSRVAPAQRKKRHLAQHLPATPGVYLFRGPRDEVLYVGTSTNIRSRAMSYFTKSETRSRMSEMVQLATRIDGLVCATPLEAQVRELRLIAAHTPPYNRRSKRPGKVVWVKLTRERWPRLSLVREVRDDDADYIGPFRGRLAAEGAMTTLHDVFKVRQCTQRLALKPRGTACVLAQLGHCLSPCDGTVSHDDYLVEVERLRRAMTADPIEVMTSVGAKMHQLAAHERFEDAAIWRDRLSDLVAACARTQRLVSVTAVPEIVAAQRTAGAWEVHVIRHGRLVASGVMPSSAPSAHAWVDGLLRGAETVDKGFGPVPAATAAETDLVLRWLESEGTRLIRGQWSVPLHGAARHLSGLRVDELGWAS